MKKTTTFLIVSIFAFSMNAFVQAQNKANEHEHHDKANGHEHHDKTNEHEHHDHSGHDMSQDSGVAVDHEHTDHSGHDMDHDHAADHDAHTAKSTEHGDGHHHHHMDHDHLMDHEGTMIMGQNLDKLPSSCKSISEEVEITVHAGRKYAKNFPGTAFAFDRQQWHVKPCSKVTFHFKNEDSIRHQFMMHGLPKYLYKYGMFHLEVTGPKTVSGTIIVPGSDDTFLVHCDISHHMEKGMKAQLVVGKGGTDIPSIPGVTPYNRVDTYEAENLPKLEEKAEQSKTVRQITQFTNNNLQTYGVMLLGIVLGLLGVPLFRKMPWPKKKVEQSPQPPSPPYRY
mgnify:CR=1 FL=1